MNDSVIPFLGSTWAWIRQRSSLLAAGSMLCLTLLLAVLLLLIDAYHDRERAARTEACLARVEIEEDLRFARQALDSALSAALDDMDYPATSRRDLLERAHAFYARHAVRDSSGQSALQLATITSEFHGKGQALPLWEDAVARLRAPVAANPENPEASLELARGLNGLGDACLWAGQRPQAAEAFRAAEELGRNLLRIAPRIDYRAELARSLMGLGVALTPARGSTSESADSAESILDEALALYEAIRREEPGRLRWRSELARTQRWRAHLFWNTQRTTEAETAFRHAVTEWESAVTLRPLAVPPRDGLIAAHSDLGHFLIEIQRLDTGRAELRIAAELSEKLARDHPTEIEPRRRWAAALLNLALAYRTGRLDEEQPLLRKALSIWQGLHGTARSSECALNEAWIHWRLGDALRRRGKATGAQVEFRFARHAAEEGLKHPADEHHFSLRLTRLAALIDMGEGDQALAEIPALAEQATPRELFALAATCSVAAGHVGEPFATRAVDLLTRAVTADPRLATAVTDHDFDPIRSRPEFQRLIK